LGVAWRSLIYWCSVQPLTLSVVPGVFAICRLDASAPIPDWAGASSFLSITRTRDELSIVCPQDDVPEQVLSDKGWRCLRVEGPLDLSLIGVLASLTAPLAQAGIGVFAISTYDTDYVLVKAKNLERAILVLLEAGHQTRR